MAKDKESKSEAIPGGVKASDIPHTHGGTKGADKSAVDASDRPAPVTTDAGMKNAPAPGDDIMGPPKPPASHPGADIGPNSGRGERASGRAPSGFAGLPSGFMELANRGAFSATGVEGEPGPADISVKDFVALVRKFIADAKAGAWGELMRDGAAIVAVFSHLMEGQFSGIMANAEDRAELAGIDQQLEMARASIAASLQSGNAVLWSGSGFNPESGSPAPQAAVRASDVAALNPQTLLILFELVKWIWGAFKGKVNNS